MGSQAWLAQPEAAGSWSDANRGCQLTRGNLQIWDRWHGDEWPWQESSWTWGDEESWADRWHEGDEDWGRPLAS
eukprot:15326639-Heterocapsa_arctica.AAC.1